MNRILYWIQDAWRHKSISHSLRSPEWSHVRGEWIKKHPTCAACGNDKKVQVHHKKPFHLYPELELDNKNFISLCEDKSRGNDHLHLGHLGNWENFNPNIEQDAADKLARVL